MKSLEIQSAGQCEVTSISNVFFDQYMPRANGEFVKVYLYLVRMTGAGTLPLSLCGIADRLNYTEQDVLRALRYWEAENLLALAYDEEGSLSGITVILPCPAYPVSRVSAAPGIPAGNPAGEGLPPEAPVSYPLSSSERRISPQRMRELKENDDIKELLFIAQRYLGKMLSPSEAGKLLYFYDELHFTTDLIEYLIEYCASKEHKSIRYIEKVALAWYEEGITTVKAARQSVSSYHRDYYEILKAIGQGGRHPIDAEISLMKKWIETYQFPMEIIREACTRTVMNTKQPSLKYTDGILSRWHTEGVRSAEDIARLDEAHDKDRQDTPSSKKPRTNAFNSFDQRKYSDEELEKKLLSLS